jgi:hypothetical protein
MKFKFTFVSVDFTGLLSSVLVEFIDPSDMLVAAGIVVEEEAVVILFEDEEEKKLNTNGYF